MEEMALTTRELIQLILWYVIYFGTPLAAYCYLKYRERKNEKAD